MSKLSQLAKKNISKTFYLLLTAVVGATGLSASCLTSESGAGCIHYAQRTDSGYDQYINGPVSTQEWLASRFFRMETTPGFFDTNLSWFSGAWAYLDSY